PSPTRDRLDRMHLRKLLPSLLLAAGLAACGGGGPGGGSDGSDPRAGGEAGTPGAGAGLGAGSSQPPEEEPEPTLVRHVAPGGDHGADGSEGAPWATIAHAVASATPGTKIVVHG